MRDVHRADHLGHERLVHQPLGGGPDAFEQTATLHAGEVGEHVGDVLASHVGPVVRAAVPIDRVVFMRAGDATGDAGITADVHPVARPTRVAVRDDLLVRHPPVAQASQQRLPIAFGKARLRDLVDVDQVELSRENLFGLVHAGDENHTAIRIAELGGKELVAAERLDAVEPWLHAVDVRVQGARLQGFERLARHQHADTAMPHTGQVDLPAGGERLAGAGGSNGQHFAVTGGDQVTRRADRLIPLHAGGLHGDGGHHYGNSSSAMPTISTRKPPSISICCLSVKSWCALPSSSSAFILALASILADTSSP